MVPVSLLPTSHFSVKHGHRRHRFARQRRSPAVATPLVAIDSRFCFDEPVTLGIHQNGWTRTVTVSNIATKDTILRFKHHESVVGNIFNVKDVKKNQILTVDRFGFSGNYDVHEGLYAQQSKRTPCLFTVEVTNDKITALFTDRVSGVVYNALIEGGVREHIAILTVRNTKDNHAPWTPIARIRRPPTSAIHASAFTLEVAPGVDAAFVIMVWLARWAEFERERARVPESIGFAGPAPANGVLRTAF